MRRLKGRFPLIPRKKNTDKSCYGHALIVAGSRGMTGAAILAARAALTSGSGLVTLAVGKSLVSRVAVAVPEAMTMELSETNQGSISYKAFSGIKKFIQRRRINSLLIGPGLSVNSETARLARRLALESPIPAVLDADGLNSFKRKANLFLKCQSPLVLTPHRREFERVFGLQWPEERETRAALAKKLCKFYDVMLVLKGCRSLVVSASKIFVNTTGNPAMAKGGSGDVLSGVIAAFIAQGLDAFTAARWAVYFHGKAGDIAAREKGELSVLASDLIEALPRAFRKV
jgi:NAD(P)H-hydrate epimerase